MPDRLIVVIELNPDGSINKSTRVDVDADTHLDNLLLSIKRNKEDNSEDAR